MVATAAAGEDKEISSQARPVSHPTHTQTRSSNACCIASDDVAPIEIQVSFTLGRMECDVPVQVNGLCVVSGRRSAHWRV